MKEQIDKVSYQKEAKNLGIGKTSKYNKNEKTSKGDDNFSWRKGSSESGSNYDFSEKRYKKNYSNNYYKKRKRFNSDNVISNNQKDNYEEYNPYPKDLNQKIEIDGSQIKYPLVIKYKYSFKEVQKIFDKMKTMNENPFKDKEKEIYFELIGEKPKMLDSLDNLIKVDNIKDNKTFKKVEEINTNIKIPKINPLSNIGKGNLQEKND